MKSIGEDEARTCEGPQDTGSASTLLTDYHQDRSQPIILLYLIVIYLNSVGAL